jgi:hypothetical protein
MYQVTIEHTTGISDDVAPESFAWPMCVVTGQQQTDNALP